jgi:hypothetical protein
VTGEGQNTSFHRHSLCDNIQNPYPIVFGKLQLGAKDVQDLCPEPVLVVDENVFQKFFCSPNHACKKINRSKHRYLEESEVLFASNECSVDVKNRKVALSKWIILKIDNVEHPFLVDTGSQVTLMKENPTNKPLVASSLELRAVEGSALNIEGVADVMVQLNDHEVMHSVHVVPDVKCNILGSDFLIGQGCTIDLASSALYMNGTITSLFTRL